MTGPALAALATLAVQLPFFRLWFAFMDEGHMVQFADIVLKGGEFYRDATFYPLPGAFWLLAGAFEVFGPSVLVSRWMVVVEFALFVGLLYALLRRLTDARFAILGVGCLWLYRIWCFPHWQIYSYSTTSLLVLLASLSALLAWMRNRDRRWLAAAGLLYGLGVLCKQDYGAAALLAVVALLAAHVAGTPRDARPSVPAIVLLFFGPAAAVGAVTGLYYWQAGVLPDLIRFTVTNHFVGMGTYEYMEFPDLLPLFGQDPALRTRMAIMGYMPSIAFTADWPNIRSHPLFTDTALYDGLVKVFFYAPIAYLAASAMRLFVIRRRLVAGADEEARVRAQGELMLVVFGVMLVALVWLNKPQDYLHLAVLYWPLIALAIVHAHALLAGHRRRAIAAAVVVAVPLAALLPYSLRLVLELRATHSEPVAGARAGVFVQPSEARMLSEVVDYVRENTAPDERVAAIPYFPIVNFLAERMGPHRSAYIVWPFPEVPDRDAQVIAAMEETGTDLVIYHFTQFQSFNPVWEHAPELFAYLVEHFEIDRVFSYDEWGYKLAGLKRREERARAGERIIPPGAAGVALHVEEGGPPRPVPPASRDVYVQEMLWPFRPVVAVRASTRGRRTVLTVPVDVPESSVHLQSAVAVHPQWWFKLPPSWVEFSVAIRGASGREVVFRRRLNPTKVLGDRDWFDIDVPLDRWSGQAVEFEFVLEAERPTGTTLWMGGWEIPRLVAASEAARPEAAD